jgi:hypothetical protein
MPITIMLLYIALSSGPGILIRQNVDFYKVNSRDYFCYFLIKIRYKYDCKTTFY